MKAKSVTIKTKKVMVMYAGVLQSTQSIEKQRLDSRRRARVSSVTVFVPPKIKALAVKQADTEGLNMSAFLGNILVMYLQDCGTKIEA